MKIQSITTLALLVTLMRPAAAHFAFIVPDEGGATARMMMSENLEPDTDVKIDTIAGAKLVSRDAAGKETPLVGVKGEHTIALALPGSGTRTIHGVADLGILQRGDKPAHRLMYYPKTIVGNAFDASTALGDAVPVEIVPVAADGGMRLKILGGGKPIAKNEIQIITPDGAQDKYVTDENGLTEIFKDKGRYGAWARRWLDTPGERDGKPYAQVRQYAMLVFDFNDAPVAALPANETKIKAKPIATLPEPVASFGAVGLGDALYVYGGHTAERHEYSTASVSGKFHRTSLTAPGQWETLPGGPGVQGMNLAAHGGKIYRVGGMMPRNAPGEPVDNISIADAARFDPADGKWETLPPLPTPRSSHDLAVVGDKLLVLGGWHMKGADDDSEWLNTFEMLDLSAAEPKWQTLPQPFTRRALIVAVQNGRVYVMGGFDSGDKPQLDVDIYDVKADTWSKGPAIPGKSMNGFSPAAAVVDNTLYLSVGTGELFKLSPDGSAWQPFAKNSPRIVHRLVPSGNNLLVIGGASREKMLDSIEVLPTAAIEAAAAK